MNPFAIGRAGKANRIAGGTAKDNLALEIAQSALHANGQGADVVGQGSAGGFGSLEIDAIAVIGKTHAAEIFERNANCLRISSRAISCGRTLNWTENVFIWERSSPSEVMNQRVDRFGGTGRDKAVIGDSDLKAVL